MKRALLLIGGLIWLAFAAAVAVFLFAYLTSGAGGQELASFFGVSVGSVALGLWHAMGLAFIAGLCALIGMAMLLRGFVPERSKMAVARE